MKRALTAIIFTSLFTLARPAHSVIIPDFQVNPPDTAFINQNNTDIAFQKNGNFVVVWVDRGWNNDNRQVYFQRFDYFANPLGTATLVSDTNTGFYNQECQIATDSADNFAISYSSARFIGIDPNTGLEVLFWDIQVRLYNALGQPSTPSIQVDVDRPDVFTNPGSYAESFPHIARHKSGKFVVVWHEESTSQYPAWRIYAQFFDSNGQRVENNIWMSNPDSSEIPLGTHHKLARVAIADNERVMICWEGLPAGKQNEYPLARLFSIDGLSLRKIFSLLSISDPVWGFGSKPDVDATPNNEFVVSCNTNDTNYSYPNNAILALRVDSLGNSLLNRPLLVNDTFDLGDVFRMPRIDAGPEGYVVIWSDARNGTDSRNLMAQRFDYNNQKIGKNYRINGISGFLLQNWLFYDLQFSSQGKMGVSWSDGRYLPSYSYDIYSKILDNAEIGFYVSGDLNQDGNVTVVDLISLINYLFRRGNTPVPLSQADVNANCKVSVSDLIHLINYLFKQGPASLQGCG